MPLSELEDAQRAERDRARDAEMQDLGLRVRRFSARQVADESETTLASLARELWR